VRRTAKPVASEDSQYRRYDGTFRQSTSRAHEIPAPAS